MAITRREFLKWMSAGAGAGALAACETPVARPVAAPRPGAPRVVVVGGGYAGATAAKYTKMWAPEFDVVLVEREPHFVSCPMSNLVIGGNVGFEDLQIGYDALRKRGVRLVRDEATAIDPERREVRLAGGTALTYDRLVVAPGIDFTFERLPGLATAEAQRRVPHAWKGGEQTMLLRRQLEAMPDGGVYVLHIPLEAYRCPPGPYERACQVGDYFRRAKPRSKILVLDANPDLTSKADLFRTAWKNLYADMIEYRPSTGLEDVDVGTMTLRLEFDKVKGDVLNVIPPQRAGDIAQRAGLITAAGRWCEVDWLTCESLAVKGVHVLGDATLSAPAMPKSASMANQQGKICASALIALLKGEPPNAAATIMNACYSFVDAKNAMHVTSIHHYDSAQKTLVAVKGAGGLSSAPTELEGIYAWGWARNIWSDTFA
jgi:sulfide dehydrogenase [flavocytochrome c] flavoprotein chain